MKFSQKNFYDKKIVFNNKKRLSNSRNCNLKNFDKIKSFSFQKINKNMTYDNYDNNKYDI